MIYLEVFSTSKIFNILTTAKIKTVLESHRFTSESSLKMKNIQIEKLVSIDNYTHQILTDFYNGNLQWQTRILYSDLLNFAKLQNVVLFIYLGKNNSPIKNISSCCIARKVPCTVILALLLIAEYLDTGISTFISSYAEQV